MSLTRRLCQAFLAVLVCTPLASWAQVELTGPATADGYAGAPIDLHYTIRWSGAPEDYVVFPAEVETPEGITARVARGEARVVDGAVEVVQTVRLEAEYPMAAELPPVTIAWVAADALQGAAPPVRTVLEATPVALQIRDYETMRRLYMGVGAVVVLALGALGCFSVWWLGRRRRAPVAQRTPAERFRQALHEARQHRLDGDFYNYYRALTGAAKLTVDPALSERLGQRARAVGYQGVRPTDDELDGDFKDVERAFAGSREAANL